MPFFFISHLDFLLLSVMHRKLRNWIEDQNTQLEKKAKEAKQNVFDASGKVIKH